MQKSYFSSIQNIKGQCNLQDIDKINEWSQIIKKDSNILTNSKKITVPSDKKSTLPLKNDSSELSNSLVSEQYEIEKIIDKKIEDNITYYKIKWKDSKNKKLGCERGQQTWESVDNLQHVTGLIDDYEVYRQLNKTKSIVSSQSPPQKGNALKQIQENKNLNDSQKRDKNGQKYDLKLKQKQDRSQSYLEKSISNNQIEQENLPQEYIFESILDKRFVNDSAEPEYLVKFQDLKQPLWEPLSNLECLGEDIDQFEQQLKQKQQGQMIQQQQKEQSKYIQEQAEQKEQKQQQKQLYSQQKEKQQKIQNSHFSSSIKYHKYKEPNHISSDQNALIFNIPNEVKSLEIGSYEKGNIAKQIELFDFKTGQITQSTFKIIWESQTPLEYSFYSYQALKKYDPFGLLQFFEKEFCKIKSQQQNNI